MLGASMLWPVTVFAEETTAATGGYAATDYVWFTIIGLILVFGAYDTFFRTP
jgi:hypothetical protein